MKLRGRIYWLTAGGAVLILTFAVALFLTIGDTQNPAVRRFLRANFIRRVDKVELGQNVVDCSLRSVDLKDKASLLPTMRFNLRTRWPAKDRMPAGLEPLQLLTNAMNPGLGVRQLHEQGITGKGVSVAIVDYPLLADHPEYAGQLAAYHSCGKSFESSMHGPAVASLLVGTHCGTAPGARLYYAATADPGEGVQDIINAVNWLLETNSHMAATERIRVISISASPDGDRIFPRTNASGPWPETRRRAEAVGVLILDFSREDAFIGPCEYDPAAPEDPAQCHPVLAKDYPKFFADHLLVPVAPRTIAEELEPGACGYQYCGLGRLTFRYHGVSWAAPYCAGVLALGWQVRPDLTPAQMRDLLFRSAYKLQSGEKIIQPLEFIRLVRLEPQK
ncbi:MAG TPA: S8/S53 family peptidase [Verrucomicrobiae bacterium]|nr:S8/S53 family peptidase [Verrucomicrobiae bacterium]